LLNPGRSHAFEARSSPRRKVVVQYAFRWTHPPNQCPLSNSKIRQLLLEKAPQIPQIAQDLGINVVAGPYVFSAEHEGLIIVEAPDVKVINQFALQSGFAVWNSIKVALAEPIEGAMG
jgi:hypothetical protein